MATRRCISGKIVESDPFYELPETAQAIYFHLNMLADDDGFINAAGSVAGRFKGGPAAIRKLVEKRFLLQYGGIYVIKHWRMSNSLKNDRLKPLAYPGIAAKIWVKSNKSYTDHPVLGCVTLYETKTGNAPMESEWNPDGIQWESKMDSQPNRREENRREENPIEPGNTEFERLWEAYPEGRRGRKEEAFEAFVMARELAAKDGVIQERLELWKQSEQWNKAGGQYIPAMKNWLLRATWQETPVKMEIPQGASGVLGPAELEAIQRVLSMPIPDDEPL